MKQLVAFFLVGVVLLFARRSQAADRSLTADELKFFETRIRPLLAERCFSCHGPQKQKSNLRLDVATGVRKGGDSGTPLIATDHPEQSLLLRSVRHEGDAPKMPPKGKLKDTEIADLARWVKQGAPYPAVRTARQEAAEQHWAFRPLARPALPAVRNTSWIQTPVDHFILAALEEKGLQPAAPVHRRAQLRRVTFDLIGLPPTPEELEAFLSDESPGAYARVVDRLLASPHYGERWGRHWLDIARYADSNGLDENVAHGTAWRYRDYVVAAFNHDKPYDQFLQEQTAGDLLPTADDAQRHERLIATGFLALGPKVLAEVDEKKMEMDIIDEQIDTLGRAFLGLTLGCARCHDHKFDPVSTEDYYGLAGIFESTRTMESYKKIARWHENSLASPQELQQKAAFDQKISQARAEVQALTTKAEQQVKASSKPDAALPKNLEPLLPEATRAELKKLKDAVAALEKSAPVLPSAMGVTEGKVVDSPIYRRGNHLNPGKLAARGFPKVLAGDQQPQLGGAQSGRLELSRWLTSPDHPLTSRVMVNRVWRWHFGQGLVLSTDNFGLQGEKPSHPALLDWLARRFMEDGWSLKKLHRLIVLSSTYQQAATPSSAAVSNASPDNRLLGHANRRRLEAETLRDNLLAVSGLLDRTMGGSLLHVKNRDYLFDHTSTDRTQYNVRRRSLYLPVIRNNLYDVFQLFDATDATVPSGDRPTTTVATQALFWLNSDLVSQASETLAALLLARSGLDDRARLELLYIRAYGRPPSSQEVVRGHAALAEFEQGLRQREPDAGKRRSQAWAWLCQVVLAANEFVYVD